MREKYKIIFDIIKECIKFYWNLWPFDEFKFILYGKWTKQQKKDAFGIVLNWILYSTSFAFFTDDSSDCERNNFVQIMCEKRCNEEE